MIYHKSIGFPSNFRRPVGRFVLVCSRHAIDRSREKRFDIPDYVNMTDFDIIEVEIYGGRVQKMVLRGEYDNYDDICIVVSLRGGVFYVRTAWLNAWDDKHKSLDVSKYAKP